MAMPHSRTERVWILGAGFSRSLGGPLLNDLLSDGEFTLMEARYPKIAAKCVRVIDVFRWGKQGSGPSQPGLWPNAESFLEFLDGAETGSPAATILLKALAKTSPSGDFDFATFDLDRFRAQARQAITASCWGFLQAKRRDWFTEAWMPYVDWFRALKESDVIITFNYDLVVEQASTSGGPKLVIVTRRTLWEGPDAQHKVRLLKLHGSVNWKERPAQRDDEVGVDQIVDDQILEGPDASVIAAPGRSKHSVTKGLELLWTCAEQALREAKQVMMLGYSMPASDNMSKKRLLGALRNNVTNFPSNPAKIHLVLGNDKPGMAAAKRLRAIPEWNGRQPNQIQEHPVNAEDFLLMYAGRSL